MSLASPVWLAALLLIPAAIAVSIVVRRRARRYVIRFPAVSTLELAAAGGGPSWRRYVPIALVLGAIAALAFALARPQVSYNDAVRAASVVLVTDESGSMASNDVRPSRLAAAEKAANTFIDQLPAQARVGAVAFSSAPNAVQAPTLNHSAARALIASESANGSTATGEALQLALTLLHRRHVGNQGAAIVLVSDGAANAGVNVLSVARQAAADKIPIYTVALGTPGGTLPNPEPFAPPLAVPPDPALMRQIAAVSHGQEFDAQSADRLSSIYKGLGSQIGSVTRKREITAVFAIGGLVLLLLGAASATRWSARLP
jgi:Ca-activated chloride channel family protein